MKLRTFSLRMAGWLVCALPLMANAQLVISDTLNGGSAKLDWKSLTGACLTAGDGTGSIPACIDSKNVNLPYYKNNILVGGKSGVLPDKVGEGALRLTNGDTAKGSNGNSQTGAVVSNFTFPSNQGVKVTFSTVTYGGNAYTNGSGQQSGADGISFFLMDGAQDPNVGGNGGSLGYSCSNVNGTYDGVVGAYVGLGIDEFGNFTNSGDNTSTGPGVKPGSISLRGGGNVAWAWLNKNYGTYYPSSLNASDRQAAVQATCKTGFLQNYSGGTLKDANNNNINNKASTTQSILDYPHLAIKQLGAGNTIYNQEAIAKPMRSAAIPITYALSITQDGFLSLSYSYNGGAATSVLARQSITASNGKLPDTFRFGFTSGTGGGSNVHEITCFKAAQINASSSSAGTNVQQASRVDDGTQAYLAYYHPVNSWGQLTATDLVYQSATDTVVLAAKSNWDGSCVLTGGSCAATGGTNTAQTSRAILTWNGTQGSAFKWGNLTGAQQTALGSTDVVSYLRGDRSKELTASGGTYRQRDSVLGDIVNSSPTWVGAPALPYTGLWADSLFTTATAPEVASGAQAYTTFKANYATRTNVVYAGANDGLLHGFRAGAYGTDGKFDKSSLNDGQELIGYAPAAVLSTIHSTVDTSLDYSSPQYAHNAYVDATPGTGDLFYGGVWHTWLAGGLGGGGNVAGEIGDNTTTGVGAFYALDVTNPANFSESNASSLVLGEWTSSTISCFTDLSPSFCKQSLGAVVGTPIIRRLHNGLWAVIFGNGLNSSTGTAGIFVGVVDGSSGKPTFYFLDTGAKPATVGAAKNGIAYVTSADLDSDHIADYVYAGDLYGNVWRFDLTSATPSTWALSTSISSIFSTGGKPISTKVTVASSLPPTGAPRVIISFGTGQRINQTLTSAAKYASGTQSVYGIWDWNMSVWNLKGSVQYSSLPTTQTKTAASDLQTQTAGDATLTSGTITSIRTVTQNAVCWKGSTLCASNNNKLGWILNLPQTTVTTADNTTTTGSTTKTLTEQIVYSPVLAYGLFLVNTTVPGADDQFSCDRKDPSGYTMAISVETGGSPTASFFADATNNVVASDGQIVSGIGLSATGTPAIVTANNKPYLVQQTTSGIGSVTQVNPGAAGVGKRINWIKAR